MTVHRKIIRACTVSMSLGFVRGMLPDLMNRYEVVLLSSPGSEMDDIKSKFGVKGIAVPMERHISLIRDIKSLMALIKVFRKEKPDMVHSMTPKAGLLCMLAAWLTRVPVRVHTFTGLVWPTATGLTRRILMATDWLTCACATHIIPEGEGVKMDLLNHGITKKPLKVLGYGNVRGIDLDLFSIENIKLRIENNPDTEIARLEEIIKKLDSLFTFLFVGRIVRDKGINELVAAFTKLNKEMLGTRLILIGCYEDNLDPVSDETHQMIEKHPNIEAVGELFGDELIANYAATDCYVFPSYREGFPNTVLEAGAMGLPCIVTDINGSREIISNLNDNPKPNDCSAPRDACLSKSHNFNVNDNLQIRDNGIVIPPKDEEALYEAMKLMVTNAEMRQRMAGNARRMIAERYEQGYVRKCLLDFYDEILND